MQNSRVFLYLLLVLFAAKGVLITLTVAPWSGHDEIAHYAYLRVVAEEHRLPLIPDLDSWRVDRANGDANFDQIPDEFYRWAGHFTTPDWERGLPYIPREVTVDGEVYPSGWIYTANHPPLYYLIMTPLYHATDTLSEDQQLTFFRLAAIPLGMMTVAFAWFATRTLFPESEVLAMMVATFVAFQPQIAYESAMLNNDILAIMFTSATFWALAVGLRQRFPWWSVALTGLFFGLATLSKTTSATVGLVIALTFILGLGINRWREWGTRGIMSAGISGAVVAPWLFFMLRTYGDPTALNQVQALQSWWNDDIDTQPTIWGQLSSWDFFWNRWKETWGDFGWRLIELDGLMAKFYKIGPENPTLLRVILVVTLVCVVGVLVFAARQIRHTTLSRYQLVGVLACALACLIGYYSVLQFGTTFRLTQARYYFPMILPAAILISIGALSLVPVRWHRLLGAIWFLMLVVLNVIIYTGYVLPYWHPLVGS